MKLFTYKTKDTGKEELAVGYEYDDNLLYPLHQFDMDFTDMTDLIQRITPAEMEILKLSSRKEDLRFLKKDGVIACAPITHPQQDIICLGINYMAHAEESARYKQEAFGGERPYPIYFSKRVNEAVAHGGIVPAYENLVDSLDYEVELEVVIGKDAKNVSKEDAYNYVFGYTILTISVPATCKPGISSGTLVKAWTVSRQSAPASLRWTNL